MDRVEEGRTSKVRIVNLTVSQAVVIKYLELGLISFGNVGEVFFIAGVHAWGVCLLWSVAKVIPRHRWHSPVKLEFCSTDVSFLALLTRRGLSE